MSDRLAFEKWRVISDDPREDPREVYHDNLAWSAWQAAVASERERHRLEVHSCGPTCTMAVCVNARLRADFARECSDTDEMLCMLCLDPQDMRTDGGSLNLAKVRELIVDLVSAERERISDLVRDTYQDHLTIDSMCEAIRAKA